MKLSLRLSIILFLLLLVWGTNLIITPYSYMSSERTLTRHAKDIMQNISDLTLEQSFNHINKAKSAAYLTKNLLSANVVTNEIEGATALERYFFDQLSIYPHLAGIYFGTPEGNFFYVSHNETKIADGFRTKIIRHSDGKKNVELIWRDSDFNLINREMTPDDPYDPRERPWYQKALKQQKIVWTDPYIFFTSKKPGVTIAGPSYDDNNRIKGIVGVDIGIAELSTFISRLRVGKSGKAFILNHNGDVIACQDIKNLTVTKDKEAIRLPKVNEVGDEILHKAYNAIHRTHDDKGYIHLTESLFASFQVEGKNYLCMFTPFPDPRITWYIGVYLPEDDYLGTIKTNRLFNIFATVLISVFVTLLGLLFSKTITRPIENLQNEAKAIQQNDLTTTFDTESIFNEIQDTALSFSRMKKNLVDSREKLLEGERIYRTITNTANDAIIMINAEKRISYWNPAAEKIFGYSSDEITGKKFYETLAPSNYPSSSRSGLDFVLKNGTGEFTDRTMEILTIKKDGTKFPVELSLASLELKGEWHAVAIMRDITERKKAEQVKKRLVNDLHDGIGGSLTNIKLLAEIAKNRSEDTEMQKTFSSIADVCQDSMIEIRNYMNILDDHEANWQSLLAEMRQYCNKILSSHSISFDLSSNISHEASPPTTIVYMNLFRTIKEALTNIIKHANASMVTITLEVTTNDIHCMIADNGKGIEPKAGGGRGLLSMETRVKELGGDIEIISEDGVRIRINIPLTQDYQELLT